MIKDIEFGPRITDFGRDIAGRYVSFRDPETHEVVMTAKLQRIAKVVDDKCYSYWLLLPHDKEELARCLREIAEYEGIEL